MEMDHIEVVPHMDRWPSFHNGVAAGLRIPEVHDDVDSNWITFNKVKRISKFQTFELFTIYCLIYLSPKMRSIIIPMTWSNMAVS